PDVLVCILAEQHEWQQPEYGAHGGHQDRAHSLKCALHESVAEVQPLPAPQLINPVHQQYRVVHHDAAHHDHADHSLTREAGVRVEEDHEHTDQRHGHREQNTERLTQRLEERRSHQEYQHERHAEHTVQLARFVGVPAPLLPSLQLIAFGQSSGVDHSFMYLVTQLRRPAELIRDNALVLLILSLHQAQCTALVDRCNVTEPDAAPGRGRDDQPGEPEHIIVPIILQLHGQVALLTAHSNLRSHTTQARTLCSCRDLYHRLLNSEAVHCQPIPVQFQHHLGYAVAISPLTACIDVNVMHTATGTFEPFLQARSDLESGEVVVAVDRYAVVG